MSLGIGLNNRIGQHFLMAGPGYGGSCFPKDTLALLKTSHEQDVSLRIVASVVQANDNRKLPMGRKVLGAIGPNARGQTVALLGLTFKANTDDMRASPALAVIQALLNAGANVRAYDPEGMEQAALLVDGVSFCKDEYDAASGADAVVIVTEWDAFRAIDFDRLETFLNRKVLVDLRNIYSRAELENRGFLYHGLGR